MTNIVSSSSVIIIPILLIFNFCGVRLLRFGTFLASSVVFFISDGISKSTSPDSPVATKILFLRNVKSVILGSSKSDGMLNNISSIVKFILTIIFKILSLLIPIIKLSSLLDLKLKLVIFWLSSILYSDIFSSFLTRFHRIVIFGSIIRHAMDPIEVMCFTTEVGFFVCKYSKIMVGSAFVRHEILSFGFIDSTFIL